ncbi:pyridoxal-phosphate dependent enzyme [Streptomyces sp. 4N509B]|uniref:pyridoxal-phosphate dependent enzyme n=1 Tax=Streptomyces sp. 4N509B TaxID=3457413 RepID=UPI003FD686A6
MTPSHVLRAAESLQGVAFPTPVLSSPAIDRLVGRKVFLKAENHQRTGSFKFRGAYCAVRYAQAARPRLAGVVAAASGNHARALAAAARLLGVKAAVVMPSDAASIKFRAVSALGTEIVTHSPAGQDGGAVAAQYARLKGLVELPPGESVSVIAGAGTAALELCRDVPKLAALFVPVGTGALAAGSALAALSQHPGNRGTRVIGVEPAAGDDVRRSLAAGRRLSIAAPVTVADDLRHTRPGALPFMILQQHLDEVVTVSEQAIADAMALLHLHLHTVVEPSGAVALAGLLTARVRVPRGPVGVLLTGGNVDWGVYRSLIDAAMERAAPPEPRRPPTAPPPTAQPSARPGPDRAAAGDRRR